MNSKLSVSARKSVIIRVGVGALGVWGTANVSDCYQGFGGKADIKALINILLDNVANIPALERAQGNQVCMMVADPCKKG